MALKETLILGAVGAAGIYAARAFVPSVGVVMDKGVPTTRGTIPLVPEIMTKNSWSFAFTLIPAIGAWYLSK